jgi:hypothetical protein
LFYSAVISDSVILFPSADRDDVADNYHGVISVKIIMNSMLSSCETFTRKMLWGQM